MDKKFGLDEFIGLTIKSARKAAGLKIVDVGQMSGISQGMISKIENAQVSPSLDSLNRLCDAIGMPISQLLTNYNRAEGDAHFTKSGEGLEVVRRGTDKGHEYRLLNYQRGGTRNFEPFLVTMDDLSEFPDEAPSDPNLWFQLFQKLSCTEYENAEDDYWVSDIKGFTEYTYELVDSDDNVIDSA